MTQGDAKLLRVLGGRCYFAEVSLDVEVVGPSMIVLTDCTGAGFERQGAVEYASASGYDDWKQGAIVGSHFGLRVAGVSRARIAVRRIGGTTADTNPTVVAACAARAVWNALGIAHPSDAVSRLDALMAQSHARSPTDVPDLA